MSSGPERFWFQHASHLERRIAGLIHTLGHTGTMATERIALPGTERSIEVTRPTNINLLLDQAAADPEQNLPYWAEIWPSGIALAAAIALDPDRLTGRRVLELGCGLGITAAIALTAAAHLTVTDYAPESLALTRVTTLRNAGREPESLLQVNWRTDAIRHLGARSPFDIVLAADVLYERRDIEPLVDAMEVLVAPDGALWLAEPERDPARVFLDEMRSRGWSAEATAWEGPWPDPEDAGITVRTHWLTRSHHNDT